MEFRAIIKDVSWVVRGVLSEEEAAVKACREYRVYGNDPGDTITILPIDGLGNLEGPVVFRTAELAMEARPCSNN